jgi:hypothetical protein
MYEALADAPEPIVSVADRVAQFEVVPQTEADALVDILANVMLEQGHDEEAGLNDFGLRVDDVIGVVAQMSEDFFR